MLVFVSDGFNRIRCNRLTRGWVPFIVENSVVSIFMYHSTHKSSFEFESDYQCNLIWYFHEIGVMIIENLAFAQRKCTLMVSI